MPTEFEIMASAAALFGAMVATAYTFYSRSKFVTGPLKKYINFIALGIEPEGNFLNNIRRTTSKKEFMAICKAHLDHQDLMPLEPLDIPMKPKDVLAGAHR